MYEELSETTALSSGTPQPTYAFESSVTRLRKRRVRQFQCCVCMIFLSIITVAIIISVACNIRENEANDNATNETNTNFYILINTIPLNAWNETHSDVISDDELMDAVNAGREALKQRELIEDDTPELERDSPSYKHQRIVATSDKARQLGRIGYVEESATKHLTTNKFFNGHPLKLCTNKTAVNDSLFKDFCNKFQSNCTSKYRTFDGTCNNLRFTWFGSGYQSFRRILRPVYSDGISAPRLAVDGGPLPSARQVSLTVHRPIYKSDPEFTIMLAVFGQFLDHDITATALSQGRDGRSISCCRPDAAQQHPECFPVLLDANDPNYTEWNVTCMEFVRSLPAATCCFGPREQLNQATSFIDGSAIYGDAELSRKLRSFTEGKLRMMMTQDGKELLPPSEDLNDGCNRAEEAAKGRYCFATGDGRANENLHLTSMHLLWAREHNRIAGVLHTLNTHWDDEKLFQETRKVIGAQLQHITYNEFLPILFGEELMTHFELAPMATGYYGGYNATMDATAANVFATAAFRFAHTLIPSLIRMIDNRAMEFIELRRMLLDPFQLYDNGTIDRALHGALATSIEANDAYFSNELKQHMFERPSAVKKSGGGGCGLDLVSLNIQRGRDHGIAGYTSWREHCGLRRPHDVQQLAGDIDDESLRRIGSVYRHVDDIDLYTGAISEKPIDGGFLGPTLTCLILDQFLRLKRGDRFWYEHANQFTPLQLNAIRKSSLARIICDNSDGITEVQAAVMEKISARNKRMSCAQTKIPSVDLIHWREIIHTLPMDKDGVDVDVIKTISPLNN